VNGLPDLRIRATIERMEDMQFSVQVGDFAGPLDLLLNLIRERKLYINEISLAQVTDDYLAYISSHSELPMKETSEFVAIAATLLLIKSRSLLPDMELTDEETESIENLERRLEYYRLIKRAAFGLDRLQGRARLKNSAYLPQQKVTFSPGQLTVSILHSAMIATLKAMPTEAFRPTAHVLSALSLEEVIEGLKRRLMSARILFSELSGATSRADLILHFLAVLELVRGGGIEARQTSAFADIIVESEDVAAPRYGA